MPRQSLVHYIAPSAISITPNCNGSASDLAVYMARDTKIKVYSEAAKIGMATTNTYQEWTLAGRNRRLADSSCPYTIYARLPKYDKTKGYLVFVKQQQVGNVWKDKYPYIIKDGDGLYHDVYGTESNEYYYIRMGEVSLPAEGKREVNLDTGILGTDQYNEDWNLNPDNLPMRVELNCIINDEDAGPTPYVYWGETLQLVASLIKGWSDYSSPRLDHWEITRDSGNATADAAWPGSARAAQFASTGIINLSHSRNADDFNGAVNATFTVNAWGYPDSDSSGTPQLQTLESASICIMAETVEKYELMLSTEIVSYNPQTQEYTPEDGVKVNIRATDQRGDVFDLTTAQITSYHLAASYAVVDGSIWTSLTFSDVSGVGIATIPISFFAAQQSANIRLLNSENKEVARKSIAFVRDGEDSREREWIFLRSATPINFGTQDHPYPADIAYGEVEPTGAAGHVTDDKNQNGWVPEGWWDEQRGTEEDVPYEYGSYRNFIHATGDDPDGHWGDFSVPSIWSHYGQDGNGIVSITKTYAISAEATTANDNTAPSDITTWSAGSPATTPAKPYLWAKEVTVYTDTTKNTTKYYRMGSRGDNGIDAQDVEWVYIRTKTTIAPVIDSDNTYTDSNGNTYTVDDHLPKVKAGSGGSLSDIESDNSGSGSKLYECTDNPKGTDDTWKYEWEIKRTKGNADSTTHKRTWNAYSGTMILRTDPAFNRYISTILGGATGNATTVANAQKAVLGALDGTTVTDHGLMLTSLIALRKLRNPNLDPTVYANYDTWGGVSGMYDANALGHGIAAWYGGDMIDYETLTDEEKADGWDGEDYHIRYAKSLFRMNGTGYLAGGKIRWDENGDGYVANGNVAWTTNSQGVTTVTINGVTVQSSPSINTQQLLLNGIDITTALTDIFDMFEKDTTTVPGTTLIKAKYSLYSVGDVSAMGHSSSGGGGGGGGGASVLYELNDVLANEAGTSVLDAQDGYVLTCVTNGGALRWKAAPAATIYNLPLAANGTRGGVQIGYTTDNANRLYAVQLSNEKMYVNVPWTDDKVKPLSSITYGENYLQYDDVYAASASNPADAIGNPTADWYHHIVMNHANSNGYFVDIALCFHSNDFYYRRVANGVASDWVRVIDSSNISSQRVSYASSAGSATTATSATSASSASTAGISDKVVGSYTSNGGQQNPNYFGTNKVGFLMMNTTVNNNSEYKDWIIMDCYSGNDVGGGVAFGVNRQHLGAYIMRSAATRTSWAESAELLGTHNYDSYAAKKTEAIKSISRSGTTFTATRCDGTTFTFDQQDNNTWRPLGTGANDACAGNDSRLSDARPASDVYSWAKQSTKPSYTLDEVSDGSTRKLANYVPLSGTTAMTGSIVPKTDNAIDLGSSSKRWRYIYSYGMWGTSGNSLRLGGNDSTLMYLTSDAKCGIGISNPSYKLHVSGDIYATGDVTAASDKHKKEFMGDVVLSLDEIANAPAVKFRWNDNRDELVHIGTYAQYWQKVLPESVRDNDGELGQTYGSTALVAVVNLARYVKQLLEEIGQLKKEYNKSA